MTSEPDIAVIGAGAAGIGAARRLQESGHSFIVLESMPRLGGRAWTQNKAGMALDLGCGWLHSADRNPWTRIAEKANFAIDRKAAAWGTQYHHLGFSPDEQSAAHRAFEQWSERLAMQPFISDRAADALRPDENWVHYLQAMSGFISGDELERVSVKDYLAYDAASTNANWRIPAGYGTLICASFPSGAGLQLATPIESIGLGEARVTLQTAKGKLRPRAVILTVSSNVLAGDAIDLPAALDPWRDAAARLPLGQNEKLYFEIVGSNPFAAESHVLGNPNDPTTGSYYIRPLDARVIECFLGGAGARQACELGTKAAFARAADQLVALFGASVRRNLRPMASSDWTRTPSIGGAYSHALPGQADARLALARPFDGRIFFAGEATHSSDFSTAHGAYHSGMRAADEAIAALAERLP